MDHRPENAVVFAIKSIWTSSRFKPANVLGEGSRRPTKSSILFSFETDFAEGCEGQASRSKLWQGTGQRRAFTPAVILFIALPEAKDNIEPG